MSLCGTVSMSLVTMVILACLAVTSSSASLLGNGSRTTSMSGTVRISLLLPLQVSHFSSASYQIPPPFSSLLRSRSNQLKRNYLHSIHISKIQGFTLKPRKLTSQICLSSLILCMKYLSHTMSPQHLCCHHHHLLWCLWKILKMPLLLMYQRQSTKGNHSVSWGSKDAILR